jgi:hypothetical protein
MAVAFGTSNTAVSSSTGATLSVTKPSSTVSGNMIIVALEISPVVQGGPTVTGPSGFTAYGFSPVVGGSGSGLYVWWKIAGGSEPASYSVSLTPTGYTAAMFAARFTGIDTTTPNGNTGSAGAGTTTSLGVAAPTGIAAGGLSVIIGGARPDTSQSSNAITMPSTSAIASFYSGSGFGCSLAMSTSTATASGNMTLAVANEISTATIVLRMQAATSVNAEQPSVTSSANDAGPDVDSTAESPSASATANDASVSVTAGAAAPAAASSASDAIPAVAPAPGAASASVAANNATVSTSVGAEQPTAAGSAGSTIASPAANAGQPAAVAAANIATVLVTLPVQDDPVSIVDDELSDVGIFATGDTGTGADSSADPGINAADSSTAAEGGVIDAGTYKDSADTATCVDDAQVHVVTVDIFDGDLAHLRSVSRATYRSR